MAVHDESADNGPNYKSDVELWNEVKVYIDFNDEGNHYICRGCKNYLLYERFPPNSHKNKLDLYNIYKHDDTLNLGEVEAAMIALNIALYFKRSILNKIKD